MKKISETVVFFGSGPVAAASLEHICKLFPIEMVITKATPPHHKTKAPVELIAGKNKLTLVFANNRSELDQILETKKPKSRLGIIVDFGVIVSQKVIDAFELGIINSHFSLLPQWRGADPITFAILSGQPKTGVSLMLIEPTLDTGKILVQKSLSIKVDDTTSTLTAGLIKLSNSLLEEYAPRYLAGSIQTRSQPHPDRASYSRKLTKADGQIDWHKSAKELEREVRAFVDWPKSYTTIAGKEVIITKAKVTETNGPIGKLIITANQLGIHTGQGTLIIERLKPSGKAEMSAGDFIRGYIKTATI